MNWVSLFLYFAFLSSLWLQRLEGAEEDTLFRDLELIKAINRSLNDELPFFYNFSMMGGYFSMPSARMPKTGVIAGGFAHAPPYQVYGVNFQVLDRIELSANYRIYKGVTEKNFGHEGFGDDAERIGNAKLGILMPQDGYAYFPQIAIGLEDFLGTKRFNSQYIVLTQSICDWNLECSVGWGHKRINGFFGGVAWTPLRDRDIPILKNISLMAEYDAYDYKKHVHEHPSGRKVRSRINAGLSFIGWDTLQLSVSSLRGAAIAASASLRYPLGSTKGIFPKVDDTPMYKSPINTEPLGRLRTEQDLAQEIAFAFSEQGLDLYKAYFTYDAHGDKELWLKLVNNRYREEAVVRDRVQHVLAALIPSDVKAIVVIVEAYAVPCQMYCFRNEDLQRWRYGIIDDFEMKTLSPMKDVAAEPGEWDTALIFKRHKPIWTFTIRPRLLTFFGSTQGKFKYNFSALASQQGYLFDEIYYGLQGSYAIKSSFAGLGGPDRNNPSKLPNVRTDTLKYFQTNSFSLEQAFLQKSWNLGRGWFYRLGAGYFEPAYGGVAAELLYYPARSNWAVGLEFATEWKRRYHGIKFTNKIPEFKDGRQRLVPFVGIQYFLDFYYDFKPLNMDLLVSFGQFLAKDKGVRTEVGRYFKSGVRFALWCTMTNGDDHVNGKIYFDKGFSFLIPLDIFLKQSSLSYVGYAMAAWLRDVGARAATGKRLYWTLEESRYNF
ncbi:MAG TPA: YjbH domain-containing protein [Rhabdochlamydiaceae bacterium]